MSNRSEKNVHHNSEEQEINFYVMKRNIPLDQIRTMLKHRKLSEDKMESFITKIEEMRRRCLKYAQKFIAKNDNHYGEHNIPQIINNANKFAERHELTLIEKESIIDLVLKTDVNGLYNPDNNENELKLTEMAKFMGEELVSNRVLNLDNKDVVYLHEIEKMYELYNPLYEDMKRQTSMYRDCAPEAITGKYDVNKHNMSTHIHPVVVALFLPKVEALEKRMLYSNVGRTVLNRALPYVTKEVSYNTSIEGHADHELRTDIILDPNSLAYFSNDTPINNMLKRFKIQIELWKNIQSLRSGRYYASGYDEEGINGFLRALSTYDWSFYDSPEMFHIQDEGTVLRKLLAVFSFRPSLATISSMTGNTLSSNYSIIQRKTHIFIPIINVRLPNALNLTQSTSQITSQSTFNLSSSLDQSDWYIENKILVPKHKNIVYSRDVLFFYVNRRFQAVNTKMDVNARYVTVPVQTWNIGQSSVNETLLSFQDNIQVNAQTFCLRSVVTIFKPPVDGHISVGSTAIITTNAPDDVRTQYLYYNPLVVGYVHVNNETGTQNNYMSQNDPITIIPRGDLFQDNNVNFINEVGKCGTIFMYVNKQ